MGAGRVKASLTQVEGNGAYVFLRGGGVGGGGVAGSGSTQSKQIRVVLGEDKKSTSKESY